MHPTLTFTKVKGQAILSTPCTICSESKDPVLSSGAPPPYSRRTQTADRGVAEFGKRRPGGYYILLRFTKTPARLDAACKGSQEGFAKTFVHEAVDDGVDTSRRVRQEVNERDGGPREDSKCGLLVEGLPGVGDVDGHPAYEEHGHNDNQHADDSLLGHEFGLRIVGPCPVYLAAVAGSQCGHLHGVAAFVHLDVAAVTLVTVGS